MQLIKSSAALARSYALGFADLDIVSIEVGRKCQRHVKLLQQIQQLQLTKQELEPPWNRHVTAM